MEKIKAFFGPILHILLSLMLAPEFCFGSPVDYPGLIPPPGQKQQATDVIYNGNALMPDQLSAFISRGQDVSMLNPRETTDLWHNVVGQRLNPATYSLGLPEAGSFHYLDKLVSRIGNFRFTVSYTNAAGVNKTYVVLLGKTMHNILLRKALLEKLGYVVPPMQFMAKMKVQFSGAFSRKAFIEEDLRNAAYGDPARWVLDIKDANSDSVQLQDALILSADDPIYDLALGTLTSSVVQGRRLLNSLMVPYNLVDILESINSTPWTTGKQLNEGIFLPFEGVEEFNPSYEDAKWLARRLAQLSTADFAEIVAAAKLPPEVGMLLTEKIISRRNSLIQYFALKDAPLPFDGKISFKPNLVEGKLTQSNWPGYAPRFAFGDPESPISKANVIGLFRSAFISSTIANMVFQFNQILPHTNIPAKIYDHQVNNAVKQIVELIKTGTVHRIPFGMYPVPFFLGHIIPSREVVIGSYLGTDNLVQIADSFAYPLGGGSYIGFDGIRTPGLVPFAELQFSKTRTYTHVKPIKSIAAALNEPYKNMIVSLFKKNMGRIFDPLLTWNDKAEPKVQQKLLSDFMTEFSKSMATGDSLIITDSYNASGALGANYSLARAVSAQARITDSLMVIKRIQIFKKDDTTIQIYRDPGDVNNFGVSLGIDVHGQELLSLGFTHATGKARTDFFELNIDSDLTRNPEIVHNLVSLRQLLVENSLEMIELKQKPFQIKHEFKENSTDAALFYFREKDLKTNDKITAISPDGKKASFLYRALANRTGQDYESLAIKALDGYLQYRTGRTDLQIDVASSGNPGDSIFGSAVSRRVSFEAELANQQANSPLAESYANITENHKGWNITKAAALDLLATFNNRFGTHLFWPGDLNDTSNIQLYAIDLQINIYQSGIDYLTKIPPDELQKLFDTEAKFPKTPIMRSGRDLGPSQAKTRIYREALLKTFIRLQNAYRMERQNGQSTEAVNDGAALIDMTEVLFPGKNLVKMVGGSDNIFIQARINGFRKNDEAADNAPLTSNGIAIVGSRKVNGPLRFIQTNLKMGESEFFLYWLLNRI